MNAQGVKSPRSRIGLRLAIGAVVMGVTSVLVGCSSDQVATPSSGAENPTSSESKNPTFALSEFSIKLGQPTLSAGQVTLTATNVGSEEHELVLVKASAVSDLPTKADGSEDEDKIPDADNYRHGGPAYGEARLLSRAAHVSH